MLTGWGRTLTTWTPRITAHAVDPEQVDQCLAVCGAELVVINLARPWSGDDAADGLAGPLLLAATGRLDLPGGYSVL
jgi:hypothetical protein